MKVLVTGATGYIASQIVPSLRQRHELVLCDVRSGPGVQVADIAADLEKNRALFRGVDAVVHLAFNRREGEREYSYEAERVNVDMAYNVYRLVPPEGEQPRRVRRAR